MVFSEGETATFLPAVLTGKVKMVRYPEPGKELIIGTFKAGEIFAIPPALDGKAFPATAVAMEPTRILMLDRARFLKLIDESREFASVVMNRMCGILRDRADTIHILSSSSAEQRVARVLISLADQAGRRFPLKVTLRRQDIAEMAGLTLESTIRSVRRMAARGLFNIIKGKITLDSADGLERLVRS